MRSLDNQCQLSQGVKSGSIGIIQLLLAAFIVKPAAQLNRAIDALLQEARIRHRQLDKLQAKLLAHCQQQGVVLSRDKRRALSDSLRTMQETTLRTGEAFAGIQKQIKPDFEEVQKPLEPVRAYSHRILVADDDVLTREVLSDMIEALGYKADSVESGADAIARVQLKAYDLIVMDGSMPNVDGYTAAKTIGQLKFDQPPVIVGLSASPLDEDRKMAEQASMAEFIVKPLGGQQLAALLHQYSPK